MRLFMCSAVSFIFLLSSGRVQHIYSGDKLGLNCLNKKLKTEERIN